MRSSVPSARVLMYSSANSTQSPWQNDAVVVAALYTSRMVIGRSSWGIWDRLHWLGKTLSWPEPSLYYQSGEKKRWFAQTLFTMMLEQSFGLRDVTIRRGNRSRMGLLLIYDSVLFNHSSPYLVTRHCPLLPTRIQYLSRSDIDWLLDRSIGWLFIAEASKNVLSMPPYESSLKNTWWSHE